MSENERPLGDFERAAFTAAIVRMNRAGFELRSAENAFGLLELHYLKRAEVDPEKFRLDPPQLTLGQAVIVPREATPAAEVPAPAGPPPGRQEMEEPPVLTAAPPLER